MISLLSWRSSAPVSASLSQRDRGKRLTAPARVHLEKDARCEAKLARAVRPRRIAHGGGDEAESRWSADIGTRVCEIRMVQHVQCFGPELKRQPLSNGKITE